MALTYLDVDTVNTGVAGYGLTSKAITAMGNWCYGILTEHPLTADHTRRVAFVRYIYSRRTPSDLGQQRFYARNVVTVLLNQGYGNSSSDSDVQTATEAILTNLLAAYQ